MQKGHLQSCISLLKLLFWLGCCCFGCFGCCFGCLLEKNGHLLKKVRIDCPMIDDDFLLVDCCCCCSFITHKIARFFGSTVCLLFETANENNNNNKALYRFPFHPLFFICFTSSNICYLLPSLPFFVFAKTSK